MLGVQRTTVTAVARGLQDEGRRSAIAAGSSTSSTAPALEQLACECYGAIHRTYERLLPPER